MDCSFSIFFLSISPLLPLLFFPFASFLISSGVKPIYRRIGGGGTFFSLVPVKPARLIKKEGAGGEKPIYTHADTHTRREKTGKLLLTFVLFFFSLLSFSFLSFFFHLISRDILCTPVLGAVAERVQRKVARKLGDKSPPPRMWDVKKKKKRKGKSPSGRSANWKIWDSLNARAGITRRDTSICRSRSDNNRLSWLDTRSNNSAVCF